MGFPGGFKCRFALRTRKGPPRTKSILHRKQMIMDRKSAPSICERIKLVHILLLKEIEVESITSDASDTSLF